MAIKLKDIPVGRLTPEEAEALSNKTFDYADKERVSMREAERRIKEEVNNDSIRRQLLRAGDFEAAWRIPSYKPPYILEKGPPGDFTFKEKIFEFGKAVHRGLGAIVKFPGVALKMIGEQALTRAEIAELKKSPYAIQRLRAKGMESPAGKGARAFADMLRRAGNKYIEVVNGMMLDESSESKGLRSQAFMSAPLYRTSMAAGESVPTYGLAIITTLTSGNPNLGLLVLGTTTASSSYESLRQQGVEPDLALIGATLEGSIEMITEKIPMDMLMKGAARPLLIRALSIGTAESFQELFAQLGQNYVSAVVKDIDPEDYSTVLQAAQQEWSVIQQGWEDAMAAGFLMGAGGGALVSGGLPAIDLATDLGFRTADQMRADYGFVPRTVNELISLTDQIKQKVKDVEKKAKEAKEAEKAPEAKAEVPTEISAMTTEQLHEKFRDTKVTEPEWQTLYEEVVRRKEAEVPPTEAIAAPEAEWSNAFAKTYNLKGFSETIGKTGKEAKTQWEEFKVFSQNQYIEDQAISEHFELWQAQPTEAITAPEKPVAGQALVKAPMGYIKAVKNAKGKYEIKMGREAPDNPFTNEIFTGEFDTPQIARKSYEAWFMKQQKPVAGRKAEIAPVTQPEAVEVEKLKADAREVPVRPRDSLDTFIGRIAHPFKSILEKYTTILEKSLDAPKEQITEAKYNELMKIEKGDIEKAKIFNVNLPTFKEFLKDRSRFIKAQPPTTAKPEAVEYGSENILITTTEYEKAKAALAAAEPSAEVGEKEWLEQWEKSILKEVEQEGTYDKTGMIATTYFVPPGIKEKLKTLGKTPQEYAKDYVQEHKAEILEGFKKDLERKAKGRPKKGFRKGFVRIFTPEDLVNVGKVALYHFESGLRTFKAWSERMITEFGDAVKPHLLSLWEDLEGRVPLPAKEIGVGEEKPRGTSVSVMAQAIENEIVEENKAIYDEIPTYRAMNMREQAEKALALIESDVEKAKRIAFYQEPAPPDLFPENVFSALRTYAKMNLDIDLIMDLALKEDVVREHTIMGKRIKSLDTDQDYADPVRAIREVVESRMEQKVRRGEDISALEVKLRELQAELDKVTKERAEFTKRAERTYGKRNKLVSRTEYDSIMARRKKEAVGFAGRAGGMAYVPTAQDFTDIAKIATFHLEAMGRDFAKWSYQMTRDFGDWITPHLQDEYDKAIAGAKKAGVEIKESKRLITKKKRLATTTGKIEAKLEELDLAKVPRIPIELDEEGQRLQTAYDLAREKYKAAQAVANIITEKEVRIIAQLSKDASERKTVMEKSERRKEGEGATQTELEYGTAISMFLEFVNDLKVEANKRTMGEVVRNYLKNPVDFISDVAGTMKAAKASLDNSFHLRQGLPTFLKAITGHIPSAKIWWKTFTKSWKMMWDTLKKRKVMRGLFAEMISDPDYDLLKKSKVALNVIEEEIPVDIPSRIPLLGMLFRMGENAFVGSSRYMRYQLAKQYLNVWRKSGIELNQRELESLGRLANSQTGRGEVAGQGKKPGLLNNLFWSPRNLRAYVDILTVHIFDRNFSPFARKQAAINLLRYISGAAMILALAKWIDDDSVTWDMNSSDFGKIKIGNTRFSVGGGMAILVILASRLVTRKFTSSTTGVTKPIDTGKFGALGGKDLVFNFVENKLSPAAGLALSIIDQKTWDGSKLTIPQMVNDALTPLIIQNVFETGSADDSANVLAALIAETMGVNVQTYSDKKRQKTNKRTKL